MGWSAAGSTGTAVRRDDVVVRTVWHHAHERIAQRVCGRDGSQVVVGMDHVSIYQGQ